MEMRRDTARAMREIGRSIGVPLDRVEVHQVALVLACIPLLLGPPLIAILLTAWAFAADRKRLQLREWQRVPLVAAINIAGSIFVLNYVSESLWEFIRDFMPLLYPTLEARPPDGLVPV